MDKALIAGTAFFLIGLFLGLRINIKATNKVLNKEKNKETLCSTCLKGRATYE